MLGQDIQSSVYASIVSSKMLGNAISHRHNQKRLIFSWLLCPIGVADGSLQVECATFSVEILQ